MFPASEVAALLAAVPPSVAQGPRFATIAIDASFSADAVDPLLAADAIHPAPSTIPIGPTPGASTTAAPIETLERRLTLLGLAVAVLVEGLLVCAVRRFRANDEPEPTETNRGLELAWLVATVAILGIVGLAAANVLAHPALSGPGESGPGAGPGERDAGDRAAPVEVVVEAERFEFAFAYAGEDVRSEGELVLPADRPVVLRVTSADVVHSFHVPDLGLKQQAIPNEEHAIRTTPTEPGEHRGYCAEYCGHGHSEMRFTVRVVEDDEFEAWLEERGNESGSA